MRPPLVLVEVGVAAGGATAEALCRFEERTRRLGGGFSTESHLTTRRPL
jgi:hypothetical protein